MSGGGAAGNAARGRPSTAYVALLVALVSAATLYGLLVPTAYRSVPSLLVQTWRAQDLVTLATLPLLLLARRRALAGSLLAHVAELGVLFWLTYCYAHLSFATPFNVLFPVYVAVLGLSGWAFLDGLVRTDAGAVHASLTRAPRDACGWFLVVSSVCIAGLWVSDIAIGLMGGTPANLHLADLPNPTWVLDLAWVLPLTGAAGVLLLRKQVAGELLAGILLVALTVLSAAMLATTPFGLAAGLGDDPVARPQLMVFTVVFAVLAAVEVTFLAVGTRRAVPVEDGWIAAGWWGPGAGGGLPENAQAPRGDPDGTRTRDLRRDRAAR